MTLKICYVLRHFPLPSETFVINEIISLQELGVQIYPVSMFEPAPCHETLMSRVGNPVYDLAGIDRRQAAEGSPFFAKARELAERYQLSHWYAEFAACVADHAVREAVQMLHAHFATESALATMLASELTGIPFSFTAHAYDIFIANEGAPGEILDTRLDLLVKRAAQVFTISNFNKDHILAKTAPEYGAKISVIHCGIATDRFCLVERGNGESTRFLCVGRFVEKKGHEFLIRAFHDLLQAAPTATLTLIGEGALRTEMMELCHTLGIQDRVLFLGACSSDVVTEEMKKADVFVLHSVKAANNDMEGIPVSLMEASATGLPVISTEHSGIAELVQDGVTGLLCKERDVATFSGLMLRLCQSPDLRRTLGAAGALAVKEFFNQATEANKLAAAFRDIVTQNSRLTLPASPENDPCHLTGGNAGTGHGTVSATTSALPRVSVVVPMLDAAETLKLCLDSLVTLEYPKELLQIIIVDNGSTDGSLEIAKSYDVLLLQEESVRGSYAARNKGILAANGDLIAFTDADCVVTPGWLTHLVRDWDNAQVGCFAGEIEAYSPQSIIEKFSDRAGILRQGGTLSCPYLPYTQTANSAYRSSVLAKVGLFAPEMTSGGDADIAWRMQKQMGLQILFVPEALVYHKHRTSLDTLYGQFSKYEFGKLSWKKYYPDYQEPTLASRRDELNYWVANIQENLHQNIDDFIDDRIDVVDLFSPFLRLTMATATCKARAEITRGSCSEQVVAPSPHPPAQTLKASVVICTHNRADLLRQSIVAVCEQDFPASDYEVVVVDNNSSDHSRAVTEELMATSPVAIRYVFEKQQGLSFARNTGIRHSRGDVVVFVDDDIDAERGWLAAVHKAFEDPGVAGAGGPIRPVWPGGRPDWLTREWEGYLTINEFEEAATTGFFGWPNYPWGANIAFRRSVFDQVGVFPGNLGRIGKKLLSNEELNLCKKIEAAGFRIKFAPEAIIHHKIAPERLTKQWFWHRSYYQGVSDAILDQKDSPTKYFRLNDFSTRVFMDRVWGSATPFEARCIEKMMTGYLFQSINGAGATETSEFRRLRALKTSMSRILNLGSDQQQTHDPEKARLAAESAERKQEIELLEQKLTEQQLQITAQNERIKELDNTVQKLLGSMSWAITAPLRRACDFISHLKP